MVEPPGIAPGSGPLISRAFISIVRANPNRINIGASEGREKGRARACHTKVAPPLRPGML